MSRRSAVPLFVIAATGAALLVIGAAAPAAAHTSNMYTYVMYDSMSEQAGFAVYGKTDGSIAPLATTFVPAEHQVEGIEVAGERGTEIGYGIIPDSEAPYVRQWDHSTGSAGATSPTGSAGASSPVHVVAENPVFFAFHGLDTLNDGRNVTVLEYSTNEVPHVAIAAVDAATGALTPLLGIQQALIIPPDEFLVDILSLATNPITGITYVFTRNSANWAQFLAVDVAAGTVGTVTRFEADNMEFGGVLGSDFDADGTLYFNYEDQSDEPAVTYQLSTFPNGADYATASRTVVSDAPALSEQIQIAQLALTIEQPALPATGIGFPAAVWAMGGVLVVVAGGVTLAQVRRRSGRMSA